MKHSDLWWWRQLVYNNVLIVGISMFLVLLIPNIVKHFVHVCCVHSTFVFQIHLRHGARLGSAARLVAGENIDIQHAANASWGDDADGSPELFENFGLFLTNSKKVQPHKLLYLFD